MKHKIAILGLLCLFTWNVALAGIPTILVCLHEWADLHIEADAGEAHHCEDVHTHAVTGGGCAVEHDCTDIELQGADLIPTRVNEIEFIVLPTFDLLSMPYVIFGFDYIPTRLFSLPLLRAPPAVHWLTDFFLSKTVLRV